MSDDAWETKEIVMDYMTSRYRAFIDHTVPGSESEDDEDEDGENEVLGPMRS